MSKESQNQPFQQPLVSGSWNDEKYKPTNSDCVAVMVENFKYPTIGWYNKKFNEWVLEDNDVKGKVVKWYPLPNYR